MDAHEPLVQPRSAATRRHATRQGDYSPSRYRAVVGLHGGGASAASSVINLAKGIVGCGVLSLAYGVAESSDEPRPLHLLPAMGLLATLGLVCAYTFSLIARVGDAVGEDTYRGTWVATVGDGAAALLPDLAVTFETFLGAVAFAIIIGTGDP